VGLPARAGSASSACSGAWAASVRPAAGAPGPCRSSCRAGAAGVSPALLSLGQRLIRARRGWGPPAAAARGRAGGVRQHRQLQLPSVEALAH
jgi:hypothetical protein